MDVADPGVDRLRLRLLVMIVFGRGSVRALFSCCDHVVDKGERGAKGAFEVAEGTDGGCF